MVGLSGLNLISIRNWLEVDLRRVVDDNTDSFNGVFRYSNSNVLDVIAKDVAS